MLILSDSKNAVFVNRSVKKGILSLVYKGIYSSKNGNASLENEIRNKINEILPHLKVSGIISYSSSLYEDHFDSQNTIWITGSKEREIDLEKMKIRVTKGNDTEKNTYGTTLIPDTLIRIPNLYRKVLQNFSIRKVDASRIEKKQALELLITEFNHNHKDNWDFLYNNLKIHAENLNYKKEYEEIISELNLYRKNKNLDVLDSKRVKMFEGLRDNLEIVTINELEVIDKTDSNLCKNLAFFESYFSNYIEGTEFEVGEAYSIIFDPKHHYVRAKDGHDIKKSYYLMLDNIQNPINIRTPIQYIEVLKNWHYEMMNHRADEMIVGEFKDKKNKAGNTVFVVPEKVEEMLKFSFQLSNEILDPIKKAFFLKTTFTEIHPFEDGNGRMSRIVLNNFLSLTNKTRIIIPNVFREDYILGLKAFSQTNSLPIIRALNKACLITNEIPYHIETNQLIDFLYNNSAFCSPNESMWKMLPPKHHENENSNQLSLFSEVANNKKIKP